MTHCWISSIRFFFFRRSRERSSKRRDISYSLIGWQMAKTRVRRCAFERGKNKLMHIHFVIICLLINSISQSMIFYAFDWSSLHFTGISHCVSVSSFVSCTSNFTSYIQNGSYISAILLEAHLTEMYKLF